LRITTECSDRSAMRLARSSSAASERQMKHASSSVGGFGTLT
jgi:hypothetical protein